MTMASNAARQGQGDAASQAVLTAWLHKDGKGEVKGQFKDPARMAGEVLTVKG